MFPARFFTPHSGFRWGARLLLPGLAAVAFSHAAASAGDLEERPLAAPSGPRGATLFASLPAAQTGVVTENNYADPRMWGERYQEFSVGAIGTGVAVGDYDGDGRPDIFVVSKTESCRLFRNLGGWKFADVTDRAGVGDRGPAAAIWKQGVTMADVNNDGWLDLYVCRFNAPNLLYLNEHDGTFKESAAAHGLAVQDASVMAAFCDYDRDGRLDVYVQTNLLDNVAHPGGQKDYLLHQDRDGTFADVSGPAGVSRTEKQGHSAAWWDYDHDGWPDLYVANDFESPDFLFHNNRDGTFTDLIGQVVPRTPFSSMGSDTGDVNNDGLIDLFVADMAASSHQKDQRGMAASRAGSRDYSDQPTSAPQLAYNALFLGTGGSHCLEAATLAGLAATDWTWSVRLEDLDNDGRLDLHVTNGMVRELHNSDLLVRMMTAESAADRVALMQSSPVLAEANLAFRNLGDLRFENVSAAWGLDQKGVSFGAACGDFDGDGDLDLVYANYQGGVSLLRNDSPGGHRVIIDLRGTASNRFGVGAVVRAESASGGQVRQLSLARGYLSSSEPVVHFGFGEDTSIRRLVISWPSGQVQAFENLPVDRHFTITEPPAGVPSQVAPPAAGQFVEVSQASGLAWASREEPVEETYLQKLIPQRLNRHGPGLAVGGVDDRGRSSVVIGGTTLDPLRCLRDDGAGRFVNLPVAGAPGRSVNDGPVLLFDADGDGRDDLLVTKGGTTQPAGAPEYQPQLLMNDGAGGFRPAPPDALPSLTVTAGAVAAADFDHQGRLGIFIGARILPGKYPLPPESALLANRGGRFEDVTDALAPGLRRAGMVTSALWTDVDGDGWVDLLLTLEWGRVTYFHNDQGRAFEDWTERAGFAAAGTGWWNSIAAADFNGDGRPDYVAGNLGLNTPYQATPERPVLLFSGDFKGGGSTQLLEGLYEDGRLYPRRSRKELGAVFPTLLRRFPKTDLFARATLGELFGEDKLAAARRFAATELRSGVFLSQPDGGYHFAPLPRIAQIAPLQGLVAGDFDGDGRADIYTVQNSFAPIPAVGRFAGGLGQLLRGDGHGNFVAVPPAESGLRVTGDAKALAVLDLNQDGWPDFLVTRNNGTTLAWRNQGFPDRKSLGIALRGAAGNSAAIGARITVELADGTAQTGEVYAGSGYFSQSSAVGFFGYAPTNPPRRIRVRWPHGESTTHDLSAVPAVLSLQGP
ncbi:MAG TPA: FG-GAP-like repeat-containing protein [Lacunisphaera sp.]|nr:FG-GAP-like repeat-containing protein [Lacunisphaera sp.]